MFFVMKISKLCDLRCTYCYEYEELGQRARMSLDDLAFFFKGVAEHYIEQGWRSKLHFVLHGGEPTLLPLEYFRGFVALQRQYLTTKGIPYDTSVQTNLTRTSDALVDLLEKLDIGLGVSLDVFGSQRVNSVGVNSQKRVLENLQTLFDSGAVERLSVGAIAVLHGLNVDSAVNTFYFFNDLGLSYRILPIFSLTDPVPRMRHLTLSADQVVGAMQKVALAQARCDSRIEIYPLREFLIAAVQCLSGRRGDPYDPAIMEWALIVNTNGDAYNHSEAYASDGLLGNIFRHSLREILSSEGRKRTLRLRAERALTCERCRYGQCCNRIPIIEALPSERVYDSQNSLECRIARPMIDFMIGQITGDPSASALIRKPTRRATRRDSLDKSLTR
jgi:uncharacterized protein